MFDFIVDKENNTITIKREFAAPLTKVWAAWTQSELRDQWWAPKPYRIKTKSMDFRDGGFWLYAMVSPENNMHWGREDYQSIEPLKSYLSSNAFCDEDGNVNADFSRSLWTNSFTENADVTTVDIVIKYNKPEDIEKIIEMGFKGGITVCFINLDELLAA